MKEKTTVLITPFTAEVPQSEIEGLAAEMRAAGALSVKVERDASGQRRIIAIWGLPGDSDVPTE